MSYSTDKKVLAKIYGRKKGWIFTPEDFKGVGTRDAVASALKRHKQSGLIHQLARGLKDIRYAPGWIAVILRKLAEGNLLRGS
ncbi:MAG TPA: hypothetical protein DCZ95_02955 [Verrucomicrobia bacterium]|nr:MAG: hypothetical protein A2X46_02460 [Lentisphaerae bacterium GWF2_57_35]HBA83032.1 hypothetical protein [Verrucomicrobiota bacterium]